MALDIICWSKLKTKADLVNGKIPASQLPSYVDDIIEGYYYNDLFYSDAQHTQEITAEEGKIYVDLDTNSTYRWSGSTYVQVGGKEKLLFNDVTASTWVSDSTYSDYAYKCDLTCSGITSSSIVEIIFDLDEAVSGNYAPICETGTDTVTVYSKVNATIVIPVIREV